ncbi:hypothetical protein MRX96_014808 [Rhipicephalus microplus]
MSGRVRIEGVHVVDSSALTDLREYPEALSKVVIRSFAERTPRVFSIAVRLACSLYRVTVLDLHLTQDTLLDIPALRALCNCLSTADSLRELSLRGCGQPDLTGTFDSEEQPFSVLLEAIFKNSAIRALQLNGLRSGRSKLGVLRIRGGGQRELVRIRLRILELGRKRHVPSATRLHVHRERHHHLRASPHIYGLPGRRVVLHRKHHWTQHGYADACGSFRHGQGLLAALRSFLRSPLRH